MMKSKRSWRGMRAKLKIMTEAGLLRPEQRRIGAGPIAMLATLLLLGIWLAQGDWFVPSVYEMPLGSCVLDACIDENAVVIACPGRDMLRAWPPPVEQPWWEESPEAPGRGMACRA